MRRYGKLVAGGAVAVLLAALLVGVAPGVSEASHKYRVGQGPLDGTRSAARTALSEWSCSGLTENKLAALMLSVPVWELVGGSKTLTPSPLTLSRWDGWSDPKNRPLYSHGTYDGYKRAHWNPGVGLWQLDTWSTTEHLNHGQRIHVSNGGTYVARYLRDGYCAGTTELKSRLNNNWFGCRWDKCWDTYQEIYVSSSDSIDMWIDSSVSQWDGGVTNHSCRWGSSGSSFGCTYVNVNNIQGYADLNDPEGDGSRTPLAKPFMSLSSSTYKYAIWHRGNTGYDIEIGRNAPLGENARYAGNWYNGTSLEVWKCSSSCWWSTWGLDP